MIYEQEEHTTEENNNQIQEGRFKCLKCGEVYKRKQRIIPHISHKHRELDRVTDLKCPYCPKTYNSTTTLKVHIHTKVCTKRNDTILGKKLDTNLERSLRSMQNGLSTSFQYIYYKSTTQ